MSVDPRMVLVTSLYELPFISYGLFSTDMQNIIRVKFLVCESDDIQLATNDLTFTPVVLP